jgi:hypothetical protein
MMKFPPKIPRVFFWTLAVGLLATSFVNVNRFYPLLIPPVEAQAVTVSVALPVEAQVRLKDGNEQLGQLVDLSAQQRILTLQGQRSIRSIQLEDIETVRFSQTALAYGANGRPILRSEDHSPVGEPVTWSPIALSGFRITDSSRGRAQVILGSQITTIDRSSNATYVVNEIQFASQQGTLSIVATPY